MSIDIQFRRQNMFDSFLDQSGVREVVIACYKDFQGGWCDVKLRGWRRM